MGSRLENNSKNVHKRIESHTFGDEQGEEYGASTFGGFGDYMRRKKIKLQNLDAELRSQSVDKPKIFRGVVAHVNGYTQPSLGDLHQLIVAYGGGFLQYLEGKTACTHIIASQLTPKKKAEFARYRIVKPAWVVDSVNAGRLLPWENYRVVDEGVTQKILGFENGSMFSQTNNKDQSYRAQTETSWYTSHVKGFADKINKKGDLSSPDDREPSLTRYAENDSAGQGEATAGLQNSEVHHSDHGTSLFDGEHMEDDLGTIAGPASSEPNDSVVLQPADAHQAERKPLTAEEHNAILLSDPRMAKSSTANPDFINQYYRESRLHHLSMWKAELKAQLQARATEKAASQRSPKRPSGARRYIMHVDFDSFFAAVSLRRHPHLADLPVVIAHGSGPGSEIASCNYPARKYGVKNGMWMKSALELCSNLKVLPYDYSAYEEASRHFYDSILAMDGIVQSISIDEALIDVSTQCIEAGGSDGKGELAESLSREQSRATELAQSLRQSVKQKTGCDVSVGIGGNILLAKVALRKAKPAGQHLIKPEDILDFIGQLQVTDLPGVAHSLGGKLAELGVKYVKDIRELTKERLINNLGPKTGEKMWSYSRGIDKAEVGDQVIRKSVSAEVNWGIRFITQQQAEDFVQSLCDELHKRLLENAVKGKQMTMKIMRKAADAGMDPPKNLGHGKCDTFNKSVILGVSTNDKEVLGKEAISILRGYGFPPGELRGLGVQMQKLEPLKPTYLPNTILSDGSQRRLTFKKPKPTLDTQNATGIDTSPSAATNYSARNKSFVQTGAVYEQPRLTETINGVIGESMHRDEKPLNMLGTQFVIPSQIDPSILAELPESIRSKIETTIKAKTSKHVSSRSSSPFIGRASRSASPQLEDYENALPNQSQLDPEALAALPESVRNELMAHYSSTTRTGLQRTQSLLPQSPRKVRPAFKKSNLTPTKKHKTSASTAKRGPKVSKNNLVPTLTQSNFVSTTRTSATADTVASGIDSNISKSFLAELPEDIRHELLADQKRQRMKTKSGLNIETGRKRQIADMPRDDLPYDQHKLQLPPRLEKPTFTSRKLSLLSELREAMSAWVQEFSDDDENGPFEEDVTALGEYLAKVVLDEENMDKAVSVIAWLTYLIDDWPFRTHNIRRAWLDAIASLKDNIQEAVAIRGLPMVDFG